MHDTIEIYYEVLFKFKDKSGPDTPENWICLGERNADSTPDSAYEDEEFSIFIKVTAHPKVCRKYGDFEQYALEFDWEDNHNVPFGQIQKLSWQYLGLTYDQICDEVEAIDDNSYSNNEYGRYPS